MVICDTSVFYNLSSGRIAKAWFEKEHLSATLMTLVELSKTYMLVNGMSKVNDAAKAIKHHTQTLIKEDAYDFGIKRLIPNYQGNPNAWGKVIESYHILYSYQLGNIAYGEAIVDEYEKPFRESMKRLNDGLKKRPKLTKEEKLKMWAGDYTEQSKKHIKRMLEFHHSKTYPDEPINIDINLSEWQDLEFFVNVWTDFHKDLYEKEGKKMKDNDWIDIWLMAYVGRNDLYWTMDTYWIKLIEKNPATKKYLHPLSGKKRTF